LTQQKQEVLIIGIAGGTGSGKTTLANALQKEFGCERTLLIGEDSYYKDRSGIPFEQRQNVNYDHPDALDLKLLAAHLRALKAGAQVAAPLYDYVTHTRKPQSRLLTPHPIIIVEGILIYSIHPVREMCDLKVFIQTPDSIRFIRRCRRDVSSRGRSIESIIRQYEDSVRPMYNLFVEPYAAFADLLIDGEEDIYANVKLINDHTQSLHSLIE
jgi:uridine kinase